MSETETVEYKADPYAAIAVVPKDSTCPQTAR